MKRHKFRPPLWLWPAAVAVMAAGYALAAAINGDWRAAAFGVACLGFSGWAACREARQEM